MNQATAAGRYRRIQHQWINRLPLTLLGFLSLTLVQCGWSFDLLPSRFVFSKVSTIPMFATAAYAVCTYRPDTTAWDSYAVMTKTHSPNIAGYWSNVVIWNRQGRVTDQLNFFEKAKFVVGRDVDLDGDEELLVSFACDTSCGISIYDGAGSPRLLSEYRLYERDFRWRNSRVWETNLSVRSVICRSDSTPLLLLTAGAGHGKMPKGLVAIDPATGKEAWHHWIGGDHEGDSGAFIYLPELGKSYFVFGTYGSANGAVYEGTSDDKAYLLALDESGNEIWRWERPGPFTGLDRVHAYTDKATGKPRVIALYRCVGSDVAAESLYCVDPATGAILQRAPVAISGTDSKSIGWNPAPDGKHQFLVWNPTAGMGVFDEGLRLVRQKPNYVTVSTLEDFDADGMLEAVAESRDGKTVLLDDDLSSLAAYPVAGVGMEVKAQFQWTPHEKYPYMVMGCANEFARLRITRTPHFWLQVFIRLMVMIGGAGFLAWISVWGIRARMTVIRGRREKMRMEEWAEMASILAHDSNTPVAVLRRATENLTVRLQRAHPAFDTTDFSRRVEQETARLLNFSRQIRIIGRVDKPSFETGNIGELIASTVSRFPAPDGVQVRHDPANGVPPLRFDYRLIESLLENLLSNAVAACDRNGVVTVKAEHVTDNSSSVVLTVTDTGKGMTAEEMKQIFVPYQSRKPGGTGLGLRSAQRIAALHDGRLEVESDPGKGSKFRVVLPVNGGGPSRAKKPS